MRDTSEARRRRAEKQLRDRNGRWIEMGGNAKWTSPSGKQYSGSFIGVDSSGYALVLPPIKNPTHRPQPYRVPLKSVEMVRGKARINRKDGSTNRANEAYKNEMMDRVSENPDTSSATNAYRNEVSKAKEHFDKTGEYIGPGPKRDSEKLNRVREGYYNSTEDLRETIKNGGDPKDFSATMHDDDGNLIRLSAKRNAKGETILEARVADSRTVVHSEVFDPESDGEETSNQIYDLFDGLIEDPEEYDFERAQNNAPEANDEDTEEPSQDELDPEDEDPIEEVDPDNEFDRDVAGDPIGSEVEDAHGDVYRKVADNTWEINGDDTDTISDDEVTQTGVRERVANQEPEQEQTPTTEDSEDSEEGGWDAADQENGTTIWDEFGNRYEKESDNTWRVYSGNDGQEIDERETDDQVNNLGEVFFVDPRPARDDSDSADSDSDSDPDSDSDSTEPESVDDDVDSDTDSDTAEDSENTDTDSEDAEGRDSEEDSTVQEDDSESADSETETDVDSETETETETETEDSESTEQDSDSDSDSDTEPTDSDSEEEEPTRNSEDEEESTEQDTGSSSEEAPVRSGRSDDELVESAIDKLFSGDPLDDEEREAFEKVIDRDNMSQEDRNQLDSLMRFGGNKTLRGPNAASAHRASVQRLLDNIFGEDGSDSAQDDDSTSRDADEDNEPSSHQEEFDFTQEALENDRRELEESTQEALESGRPLNMFERTEARRYLESRRLTTDEQEELGRLLRDDSNISAADSDRRDALLKKAEGDTRPQWLINMERDRDTIGIRLGEQDPSLPRRDTSDRDLADGEDDNIQGEFDLFADDNDESSSKTSNVDGASRNTAGLKEYPVGQEFVTDDSADTVLYKRGDDEFEEYSADSEGGEYTPTGKVSTAQEVIDEKKEITSTGTYSSPTRMPRKKREAWERIPNRFVENHTPESLKLTKSQRDRYNASEDEKERRDILKKRLYQLRKLGQDPDRLGRDIRKLELRLEGYDPDRAHSKSARRSFERATKALEDGNYSKARSELESAGTALRGKRRDRSVQEAAEARPELLDVAPNNIRSIFNLPPKRPNWRPDPDEISGKTRDRIEEFIRLSQDARQNSTTRTRNAVTTDEEGRDVSSDFIEEAFEETGFDEDFVGVFSDGTPIRIGDEVMYQFGQEDENYRGPNAINKFHRMIVQRIWSNGAIELIHPDNDGVMEYYSAPSKKERAEGHTKGLYRTKDTAVDVVSVNASKLHKMDNLDINGVDDRSAAGDNRNATRTNAQEIFTRDGTHIKPGLVVNYRTKRDNYQKLHTTEVVRVLTAKSGTVEVMEDGELKSISIPFMVAEGKRIDGFDGDVPTAADYRRGDLPRKNPDTVKTSIGDIPRDLYERGDFDEYLIRNNNDSTEPAKAEDAEDGDVYVAPDNTKHIVDGDRVKGYDMESDSVLENDDQSKEEYFEKNPNSVPSSNRKGKAKQEREGYTVGPYTYHKTARGFRDENGREISEKDMVGDLNREFFRNNPGMANYRDQLRDLNGRLNSLSRDVRITIEGEDGYWIKKFGAWVHQDSNGNPTGRIRSSISFAGTKFRVNRPNA